MKINKIVLFVVTFGILLSACGSPASSHQVEEVLGTKTVEFSATVQTFGERKTIFAEEFEVSLVQKEYGVECVVSDADWARLDLVLDELEQKNIEVNEELQKLFAGTRLIELDTDFNYGGYWSQENFSDGNEKDGYICYDQGILYDFFPVEHFEPVRDQDGIETGPTSVLKEAGTKFYLDLDNPNTGAHLGLSFDSHRLYALSEGVMIGDEVKVNTSASLLPAVTKSVPIDDLRAEEVASFVVAQEDYFSRDIFVQVIESILPLTVNGPSLSFALGADQSGQVTHAQMDGSMDGSLTGMNFGGWGFITGGIEGSTSGTLDSKPVLLIRGSVFVVPTP